MAMALAACSDQSLVAAGDIAPETVGQESEQQVEAIPFLSPTDRDHASVSSVQTISTSTALNEQVGIQESPEMAPRRIGDIRPSFSYAWGDVEESALPEDFEQNTDDQPVNRVVGTPLLLQWQPSNLWYHPLYFEDPTLERYGHTYNSWVQPFVSTGRFVGQAATLPYHATLRPAQSREYPLGWYRPGECAPHLKYRLTWNDQAAINQTLAVVGLVFLIP